MELRISPRIFEKIRNGPNCLIRGLGETDSFREPKVENFVVVSLSVAKSFRTFKIKIKTLIHTLNS